MTLPASARSAYRRVPFPVRKRVNRLAAAALAGQRRTRSLAGVSVVKARTRRGELEEAAEVAARLARRDPTNPRVLGVVSAVASRRGDLTAAAVAATARTRTERTPSTLSTARRLTGRLRETDHRWRPTVAAPPPPPPPADRRSVVYLAKESRPYLHNGFCTRTHETLRWLARHGTTVMGVTMPGFPGKLVGDGDVPTESQVEEVVYHHLLPGSGELVEALAFDEQLTLAAQMLAGVVAQRRPHLLHVGSGHRGFETALVGDAVARWAGIPWIYEVRSFFETTWTSDPRYMERGEHYQRRFDTETRMMRAADLVVTLSGPMREEIVTRHGIPAEKVRIIPNAVDPGRFAPQPRDEALRERLGLAGTRTLGYVSNLSHPREGQEVLIRAVARMRALGQPVTGLVVGDGSRRAELEALAREVGVADAVVFTGNVPFDEVAAYYAQTDLFVVPRIDERAARMVSPMKPFEAMAMRVPLLVADLPALVELAGSGSRAGTFRAGDPESLAAEATRMLADPDLLARLTATAADWVARERSWEAVAAAFSAAYDDVLAAAPSR